MVTNRPTQPTEQQFSVQNLCYRLVAGIMQDYFRHLVDQDLLDMYSMCQSLPRLAGIHPSHLQ